MRTVTNSDERINARISQQIQKSVYRFWILDFPKSIHSFMRYIMVIFMANLGIITFHNLTDRLSSSGIFQ